MGAIYLVRHGQASFAAKEYDELSALGREQSTRVGHALAVRGLAPDLVICGSLRRHRQTAEGALAAMNLPAQWEEDRGWDEYDHNDFLAALDPAFKTQTGVAQAYAAHENPRAAFQAIFAKAVARWIEGAHDADYRETFREFAARVESALEQLAARLARKQTALVFTSGGTISAALRKLLGLSDEAMFRLNWSVANASVTKLLVTGSGLRLSTFNEHTHFETADRERLISYR